MTGCDLYWLAPGVSAAEDGSAPEDASHSAHLDWSSLVSLARSRMDFVQTNRADRFLTDIFPKFPDQAAPPVKLAICSASTVSHLVPGVRLGCLRRGLWSDIHIGDYGQYFQEIADPNSSFYKFEPNVVLFAFDSSHLLASQDVLEDRVTAKKQVNEVIDKLRRLWDLALSACRGQVIQQTILSTAPPLLGNNEHRLPGSRQSLLALVNNRIREAGDLHGIDVLSLDARLVSDGRAAWHDPVLWHRAKMEISPAAAPFYGDLVARIIAARRGLSAKCLVLDLDNTLWSGVVGDDGLEGIILGQGSAVGEAFITFQRYIKDLSRRGVIIAVCSKNDEKAALSVFEEHPEMILKRSDIACFAANWQDKPSNIRQIAQNLEIGMESIVFVDDSVFERNIVRRELPMVNVPELPDDPAQYANCIADAGYFEAVTITSEDLNRTQQYRQNWQRRALRSSSTDIAGYLKSLEMRLEWRPFDRINCQRIVQLINKTNQFNLTTRRYSEAEIGAMISAKEIITLQFRLTDRFGDNGTIGAIIARWLYQPSDALFIDTWLMSCRVLGRQVEEGMLNVLAAVAKSDGADCLVGEFRPNSKNSIVSGHYEKLKFVKIADGADGSTRWQRELTDFVQLSTFMEVLRVDQ